MEGILLYEIMELANWCICAWKLQRETGHQLFQEAGFLWSINHICQGVKKRV